MEWVRRLVRLGLRAVDAIYHRWHRLQPVGPLLFIGREQYRGPARCFPDGTELQPGDLLGQIHFNNARIAAIEAATPGAIGLSFARLLFASLRALAQRIEADHRFVAVKAFRGVGWLRHGEQIGFIHEPFPDGRRKRYISWHIGLLVWAYAPAGGTAIAARPQPMITWLTRGALLRRFGNERTDDQTVHDRAAGTHAT
jgi:hypothetical protein